LPYHLPQWVSVRSAWNPCAELHAVRLNAGVPYEPFLLGTPPNQRAHRWAIGSLLGLGLREDTWTLLLHHKKLGPLAVTIYALAADGTEQTMEVPDSENRKAFVEALPVLILSIHRFWRMPSQRPVRASKAARNDPSLWGRGANTRSVAVQAALP
jgi:uncharacterized protein YecA (UPF0149 family)